MQITRQISTKSRSKAEYKARIDTELVFDFADVSPEEIAQLATKSSSLIVDFQSRARGAKTAADFRKYSGRHVVNIRELLDTRTVRKTAEEKEAELLAAADPAKLLAELERRGIKVE